MTLKSLDLMCGTSICWASKNNICIDLTIPSIEEINDIEDLDSKFTDEDLKTIIDNKYFIQLDLLKDRLPLKMSHLMLLSALVELEEDMKTNIVQMKSLEF